MRAPTVARQTTARIPTAFGEFRVAFFDNTIDDKEHLAFVYGSIEGEEELLVRIHSECFTGDVVGSLRCDCGQQLTAAMRRIAEEGAGLVLYLRQEGRGIGLLDKLKAYNLQDDGYDTVEANVMLGHEPDERDYTLAALMLGHFGIPSVRLLTNNPHKVEQLQDLGVKVTSRVPIQPQIHAENERYLKTKARRMRHRLHVNGNGRSTTGTPRGRHDDDFAGLLNEMAQHRPSVQRPFVTLSYAQSLDGSIAARPGAQLMLSGAESLVLTHKLRDLHDAILVGIGTVLSDDPRLTVRRVKGDDPVPVVLDTQLRFPTDARLLHRPGPSPLIVTGPAIDSEKRTHLEQRGATVIPTRVGATGCVDLNPALDVLQHRGIRSVMVEGGAEIITSFLRAQAVDYLVMTIANRIVGGLRGVHRLRSNDGMDECRTTTTAAAFPRLKHIDNRWYGDDLIIQGVPVWEDSDAR
ncbi:MAG: GTP cyclohydrolase II [Bacteroidetes bacterium]|jgi:3,4-dihydroxy 2-butanone 4-phosphate synthase/GTP cyclohydrolase II|nr:GTP cyclohydrolase II [Bacteroidota bacterium]